MIVTKDNFQEIIDKLKYKSLVLDVETDDLNIMYGSKICGIGISELEGEIYYFPVRHSNIIGYENLSEEQYEELKRIIEDAPIIIGHNIKFDMKALLRDNVKFNYNWNIIDTQVMVRLATKEKAIKLKLSECIQKYFGVDGSIYKDVPKEYLRKNKLTKFSQIPIEILGPYCIEDVEWERKLFYTTLEIIKNLNQTSMLNFEIQNTINLLEIEYTGVRIDKEYCTKALTLIKDKKEELEKRAYSIAGKEFNAGSTKQIDEVFQSLGVPRVAYSPKGNPKWDAVSLFMTDHELARVLLNWRSLEKLETTYFAPYINLPSDIIYCSFRNCKTITGRLSSIEPNLQNIPRTTQRLDEVNLFEGEENEERIKFARQWAERGLKSGKAKSRRQTWEIYEDFDENRTDIISARRLFIPREGYTLFAIDYAQMEMIVFLSYLHNERIDALIRDKTFDIHTYIAKEAFHASKESPDFKFFRQVSKEISYGIIYGMGLETLAAQIGTEEEEAKEFKKKYFKLFPEAKGFIKAVMHKIEGGNAIHNMYNRQYYIEPGRSYLGVNYLVQGTSAEIVKERMDLILKLFRDKKSNLLLQVHDEFIVEIHNSELPIIKEVVNIMEQNTKNIPLRAEISVCTPSWIQKKKIEDLDGYINDRVAEMQQMRS